MFTAFFFLNQCFQVTCSVRGVGFRGVINVILRKQIGMSRSFSLFHPVPPATQQLEDVHAPFVFFFFFEFFLFVLMTLIASIITFSKKKKKIKKKGYPRHGTLALDMEPSTLDPRQKDRLLWEPRRKLIAHQCCDHLTAVKTRYPLTSIT